VDGIAWINGYSKEPCASYHMAIQSENKNFVIARLSGGMIPNNPPARRNMAASKPKTVPMTPEGIAKLPNNMPVEYSIQNNAGETTYIGVAKRGRVHERLEEHLPKGPDPIKGAAKVHIQQMPSIGDAERKEAKDIAQKKPAQNIKGK
jgi:hypothetical protein